MTATAPLLLPQLSQSWKEQLCDEFEKPYMHELAAFLKKERAGPIPIYPPKELVFHALHAVAYEDIRVVILGQDPYHSKGQAGGLCFSVPKGVALPPSLRNIFIEIHNELGIGIPTHGCLEGWAAQGVFLLNATLTVRQGVPKSHYGRGWEQLTDMIIQKLSQRAEPIIFLLWGKSAQEKAALIGPQHRILKTVHPSPLSAHGGFFGCGHFAKCNELLQNLGQRPIDWNL